jgi:hypothetical protein
MTAPRITIHDLGALEREFLGALFARAGGVADHDFAVAATATAGARGIKAHAVVALTDMGLVVELETPHG